MSPDAEISWYIQQIKITPVYCIRSVGVHSHTIFVRLLLYERDRKCETYCGVVTLSIARGAAQHPAMTARLARLADNSGVSVSRVQLAGMSLYQTGGSHGTVGGMVSVSSARDPPPRDQQPPGGPAFRPDGQTDNPGYHCKVRQIAIQH